MVFKCKICGGSLNVKQGERIAECEYCGVMQTIPGITEPRAQEIYNNASACLINNRFDEAEGLYSKILAQNPDDADAYWNVLMCRYGVTYVKDPASGQYMPTCNRTLQASILDDENYHNALKYADDKQRELYTENAQIIDNIQKSILKISKREKPFDIFICYKENDENGKRTQDSVIAQDIYYQLTKDGYKVFFSRITLEDKIGVEYEPYIFSALNSAKIMLVIGTDKDYFNAPWVKNEWSRFLKLAQKNRNKVIIPCYRGIDAYDIPEELSIYQSLDMRKIGFIQDLTRGIEKILDMNTNTENFYSGEKLTDRTVTPEKKSGTTTKQIAVISAAAIFIIAAVCAFFIQKQQSIISDIKTTVEKQDKSADKEKTEAEISVEKEPEKKTTPSPNAETQEPKEIAVDNNGYATYENSIYGFSCKYPSWFDVTENSDMQFTCMSSDGLGHMEIFCSDDYGYTPEENLNDFILSFYGNIEYKTFGKDYYAARVEEDSQYYYIYSKYRYGNIYSFYFTFPAAQFEAYDKMINDIYSDFVAQF